MTRPGDPWRDVTVLLVDGNNLLHAVAGSHGTGPLRGLLARLGAAVPRAVEAMVVLDGPPDPGAPARTKIRAGLLVRHAGRVGADALLVQIVESRPYLERAGVLVVTNDAALQEQVRRAGGRSRPVTWLETLLTTHPQAGAPAGGPGTGASIAGPRPRRAVPQPPPARHGAPGAAPGPADDEDERRPWRPGRGATRKRGNPQRGRRARPAG
ncbi:MAG: hypothetical protein ACP5VP_05485 [Candidatus Limnocylindrales bacterium]